MRIIRPFIILAISSFSVIFAHNEVRYLYSHGILDSHKQARAYTSLSCPEIRSFNYPDACETIAGLDRNKVVFGQKNDMDALQHACQTNKDGDLIIIGMSRGASTPLNLMAHHDQPQIKAMVLESPFDTVNAIIESLLKDRVYLGRIPGLVNWAQRSITTAFPCYDPHGLQPLDTVHLIRKDLPILIICSLEDTTVPASSSMRLYATLRDSGHDHAYLLVLDSGKHSKILHGKGCHIYHAVVHAFYKKYNLPHNKKLAARGKKRLQTCQPTIQELAHYGTI